MAANAFAAPDECSVESAAAMSMKMPHTGALTHSAPIIANRVDSLRLRPAADTFVCWGAGVCGGAVGAGGAGGCVFGPVCSGCVCAGCSMGVVYH